MYTDRNKKLSKCKDNVKMFTRFMPLEHERGLLHGSKLPQNPFRVRTI